jgi:hypothetical protein
MNYIKVKDKEHLFRDVNSNGIINTDEESYAMYIENYKRQRNSIKKIEELENQVNEIKNDMSEIKNLLIKLNSNITNT